MQDVNLIHIAASWHYAKPFVVTSKEIWRVVPADSVLQIGEQRIPMPEGWMTADPESRIIGPALEALRIQLVTAPSRDVNSRIGSSRIPLFIRDRMALLINTAVRDLNIRLDHPWVALRPFMTAIEDAVMLRLEQAAAESNLRESLNLLSTSREHEVLRLSNALPGHSSLAQDIARFQIAIQHARRTWPQDQKHLIEWMPIAGISKKMPNADVVIAWLRQHGLSRTSFARLHHLQGPALARMQSHWAQTCALANFTVCVTWLNNLLSLVARNHQTLDMKGLTFGGELAASAGIIFSGQRNRSEFSYGIGCFEQSMDHLHTLNPDLAETFAMTVLRSFITADSSGRQEIAHDLSLVRDWICGFEGDNPIPGAVGLSRKNLGPEWKVLMRGQQRWHEQPSVLLRKTGYRFWDEPCADFVLGDYAVIGMRSSKDLSEEGEALKHCVVGYVPDCLEGKSRIFSVRHAKSGKRIGTAEFKLNIQKRWSLIQFRGLRNVQLMRYPDGAINPEHGAVILELESRLNENFKRKGGITKSGA